MIRKVEGGGEGKGDKISRKGKDWESFLVISFKG